MPRHAGVPWATGNTSDRAGRVLPGCSGAAQSFPTKPIRILVGTPPGGGADFLARGLAPKLTEGLGQSIIVENRPGANGAVASEVLAHAAPDGHTLKINVFGDAVNPSLMKLNFDFLKDFSYVALAGESQNILASHPSLPATNVKGLIALSKTKPGGVTYGSQGIGASGHLSGELFQHMTGVKWVHVPYKGGAPALIDLLAGNITISFANIPTAIEHVRSKRLRALAVTGGKAHAGRAGHPDGRRKRRARLRGQQLVRALRPGEDPARDRRAPQHGDRARGEDPGPLRGAAQGRHRAFHAQPGAIHRLHPERVRQVGEGDQGGGDQGRVMAKGDELVMRSGDAV